MALLSSSVALADDRTGADDPLIFVNRRVQPLSGLCGVNSVYVALKDIGVHRPYKTLLQEVEGIEGNLSLLDLMELIERAGCSSMALRNVSVDDLNTLPLPMIAWVNSGQGLEPDHFFVIRSISDERVLVVDIPTIHRMPMSDLRRRWTGVGLLIARSPEAFAEIPTSSKGPAWHWISYSAIYGGVVGVFFCNRIILGTEQSSPRSLNGMNGLRMKLGLCLLAATFSSLLVACLDSTPAISIRDNPWKLGTIRDELLFLRRLRVENVGRGELILDEVKVSCSKCMKVAGFSRSISPGREGYIEVEFDLSDQPNAFRKSISITSNDPESPMIEVMIRGTVAVD